MKIIFLAFALLCPIFGAGLVQVGVTQLGQSNTWVVTYNWTGDSINGSVPATSAGAVMANCCQGYIPVQVEIAPGSTVPTAGYSVKIQDVAGVDILQGQAASLNSSVPQSFTVSSSATPVQGTFYLNVSGQSVPSASGVVYVFLTKASQNLTVTAPPGGGTSSPNNWLTTTNPPIVDVRRYNFPSVQQSIAMTLNAGVSNTVNLASCALGMSGTNIGYSVYISGGSGGPAEADLVTGGTCNGISTSPGTLVFTPAFPHSGGWSISSASGGIAEALYASGPTGGGTVLVLQPIAIHAQITVPQVFASGYIVQGTGGGVYPPAAMLYRASDYPAGDLILYDQTLGGGQAAFTVKDLMIFNSGLFGARVNNTAGSAIHIRASSSVPVVIDHVTFDSGWIGVNIDSSLEVTVKNCVFQLGSDNSFTTFAAIQQIYTGVGFLPESSIADNLILGPNATPARLSFGVVIYYSDGTRIHGNHIGFAATGIGLPVAAGSGTQTDIVDIVDNEFDTFTLSAISSFNGAGGAPNLVASILIANNHISNQLTTSLCGIHIGGNSFIGSLQILSNRITRNGTAGICNDGTNSTTGRTSIVGNQIFDNNLSAAGFSAGIFLNPTVNSQFTITGNDLYNTNNGLVGQGNGIVAGGFDHSLIAGNNLYTLSGAGAQNPILITGAITNTIIRNNAGIDDVTPAIASATAFTFPLNPNLTITGTTGVTSVVMTAVPPNSSGTFRTTSGAVTFTSGGGIGNTLTTTQNVLVVWSWDGTSLWLK